MSSQVIQVPNILYKQKNTDILKKRKFIKKGDFVVNLASMPANEKGTTNMMKISKA